MADKNYLVPGYSDLVSELEKNESPSLTSYSGIENQFQTEIKPTFHQTTAETVYSGKTNCLIIMGNDRPGSPGTGYGSKGGGGCATIDIVAGHLGKRPIMDTAASKNLDLDAARIYITQKTDVDANFNIPQYGVELDNLSIPLENSKGKSAVVAKADCVRLVARENIKIVTQHLGDTSLDGSKYLGGIDIIAGCDVPGTSAPQPMVKGNNLTAALASIVTAIETVQSNLSDFIDLQNKMNSEMLSHTHQAGIGITSDIIQKESLRQISNVMRTVIPNIIATNMNFQILMSDYLDSTSEKYINSLHNRVN